MLSKCHENDYVAKSFASISRHFLREKHLRTDLGVADNDLSSRILILEGKQRLESRRSVPRDVRSSHYQVLFIEFRFDLRNKSYP